MNKPGLRFNLNAFVDLHPVRFALLVTLAFVMLASTVPLLVSGLIESQPFVVLGYDAARYLLAVVLLSTLGWWGRAGFTRRPKIRMLLPFLPWMLLTLLLFLVSHPGTCNTMTTFLIVESTLAAGFTEEAIFRGVVLRSLEPKGWLSAAAISSLLFALVHLTGLFIGFNPLYIALQVLWAFLVGFSLAAPVLVTGWIWPAIILHFAINVISGLTSCKLVTTEKLDY